MIDLGAAVFGYLGLFDPGPHDTSKDGITIAQCATSLSGLPHDHGTAGTKLRDASIGFGHYASVAEQAAHLYFAVPLAFTPGMPPPPPVAGQDTGYSNTAFDLLAAVVENATGMRYVDYLTQHVAGAMGLRDVAGARRDATVWYTSITCKDRLGGAVADPVVTNPGLYSVAFENDRVRVLRYHDRPGDRTQPHRHPDSVMITASGFDRRLLHDGQGVDVSIPAGEVRWLDAQEHSGENIGTTDTVTFFVELKEVGPPRDSGPGTLGPRS